jgi:hypothetical protein
VCVSIVRSGVLDPWPRSPGFGPLPNQDPLLRKYAFLSITWVPAISIENVRAPSKCLCTWNDFCGMFSVLNPCSSAPVAYYQIRPKSQIFNIGHDYALWIRNSMLMMKKPENLYFETWDIIQPKSRNLNMSHGGFLSIENFMLMLNNHFALFICRVTC